MRCCRVLILRTYPELFTSHACCSWRFRWKEEQKVPKSTPCRRETIQTQSKRFFNHDWLTPHSVQLVAYFFMCWQLVSAIRDSQSRARATKVDRVASSKGGRKPAKCSRGCAEELVHKLSFEQSKLSDGSLPVRLPSILPLQEELKWARISISF